MSSRRPPHLAFGSDGSVFIDVAALRPEVRRALRGRRRFIGVELLGDEAAVVARIMNETGAFAAALDVGAALYRRRRRAR